MNIRKPFLTITSIALTLFALGCNAPPPQQLPDIESTVRARVGQVKEALIIPTPAPLPTQTPYPTFTPQPTLDLQATVEAVEIPVTVEGKTMNPGTIRVKQGDMVTLKIDAEDDGEFHLHGYDIEQNIDGDAVASFYFVADATGRFKITFHHSKKGDDEHKEGNHGHEEEDAEFDIGFLEVGPR